MRASIAAAAVVLAATLVTGVAQPAARSSSAAQSRSFQVGIYDDAQLRYGPTANTVALYKKLHVKVARMTLYWGGKLGVARRRPVHPSNPSDPADDWASYDSIVQQLAAAGIQVVFSIYGTPAFANKDKGLNVAPLDPSALRSFAYAAALRYSGTYVAGGIKLPKVRDWLAWNEPNNPVFLKPQYKRDGRKWVMLNAINYAKICNSIYNGVHGTGLTQERVACGATAPRGNNNRSSSRPSVSPISFLKAVKVDGLVTFDAWAHHPYYGKPSETPSTPDGAGESVELGNLDTLIRLVTQLYGNKRIWITEYGYETNPPDTLFGVSWAKQALYLKQAFAIARANPRVDMMLWFLLKDTRTSTAGSPA